MSSLSSSVTLNPEGETSGDWGCTLMRLSVPTKQNGVLPLLTYQLARHPAHVGEEGSGGERKLPSSVQDTSFSRTERKLLKKTHIVNKGLWKQCLTQGLQYPQSSRANYGAPRGAQLPRE